MSFVEIPPASNWVNCLSISESKMTKSPTTAATPSTLKRCMVSTSTTGVFGASISADSSIISCDKEERVVNKNTPNT